MKKQIKNLIIILELIVIVFLIIYIITTNTKEETRTENSDKVISNSTTNVEEAGKKEYIKTYNVIEKINIDDETGDNDYYVLKQFQDDNLVIVKIKNTYNLEINQNYEFVLYGEKEEGKTYSQNDIFENFEIKDIRKTDKVGLEQIQDF